MRQLIRSPTTTYGIERQIAKTEAFTVYLVIDEADGAWYMLKIAPDQTDNVRFEREVLALRDIWAEVERIRATEPSLTVGGGYRYEKCFPRIHESFLFTEQGSRRINILAIPAAEVVTDLVPLEQWRTRERVRLDPKSSAWLMGRLLKIFTLTHPIGVSVGQITGGNILVNPIKHRAFFFDWTEAHQYNPYVPPEKVGEEIAQAARQIFVALGGDLRKRALPPSDQLVDTRYAELLLRFMSGTERDPDKASIRFYQLIRELWEPEFHPFTTIPI